MNARAALLVVAALAPATASATPPPAAHPRLLVAAHDPFSGLETLRARYAKGARPSDDLPGWALTYLLTGDESYARKALTELPQAKLRGIKGSNRYLVFLWKALAFDWLYGYRGFDAALKDRVAAELVDGAAQMLALQSLADPSQASYHNHTARELALAAFALWAVEGEPSVEGRTAPMRAQVDRALDNILETTDLVNPQGGYHESTDYMRITWAPLALLAEMRRTRTGEDPARRFGMFANMGTTYLYKLLPDGSCARDDDDEFPHLDDVDSVVLGYAVHRFKDPYAAFLLRKSGWLPATWRIPVLQFLWDDPEVVPRDPATTTAAELPRHKLFPGIGHLVLRDGWKPESTWIELACGPYFAKHDHLDAAHFVVYRKGHLAIDSGADYTDTESPHYLNYYRRTVAHNTLLVYQPGETFFWGENKWAAANDGGQRMDSSRFWNSVRSLADWRMTRDLWDRCRMSPVESAPGDYHYAKADATRAYQPSKVDLFTREVVYLEPSRTLVVLDRVRATDASYRKAWLLHAVAEPRIEGASAGIGVGNGGTSHRNATLATLEDGEGRLRVHTLLPREREVIARGGPGVRVLDARRREGRGVGLGTELAARAGRGRAASRRPVPEGDVEDVLGRRATGPLAVQPAGGRPGCVAPRDLAGGAGGGRRLPERARDRRPRRRGRAAARGRGRGPRCDRRLDRGRERRAVRGAADGRGRGHPAGSRDDGPPGERPRAAGGVRGPAHLRLRPGLAGVECCGRDDGRRHAARRVGHAAGDAPAPAQAAVREETSR